jgi:hypothetical protein
MSALPKEEFDSRITEIGCAIAEALDKSTKFTDDEASRNAMAITSLVTVMGLLLDELSIDNRKLVVDATFKHLLGILQLRGSVTIL